jgi:hypothetical protein
MNYKHTVHNGSIMSGLVGHRNSREFFLTLSFVTMKTIDILDLRSAVMLQVLCALFGVPSVLFVCGGC